jgi:hypothetical protein
MASFIGLVYRLWVRPEPSRMKYLSGAPFSGRPLALPKNIRLGWKGLPGTNTLAYYENLLITAVKSFVRLAPGVKPIILQINYNRYRAVAVDGAQCSNITRPPLLMTKARQEFVFWIKRQEEKKDGKNIAM